MTQITLQTEQGELHSPDHTIVSSRLTAATQQWTTLDDIGSDHLPIEIKLSLSTHKQEAHTRRRHVATTTTKPTGRSSTQHSEGHSKTGRPRRRHTHYLKRTKMKAVKATTPQKRHRRQGNHWWNSQVDTLLKKRQKARREYNVRRKERRRHKTDTESYTAQSTKKAIRKYKQKSWKQMTESLNDQDTLNQLYTLYRRTLQGKAQTAEKPLTIGNTLAVTFKEKAQAIN